MKLTIQQKKLIKQFNQPETHLVISHWPEKSGSFDGIATYTQNIVEKLAVYSGDQFVILAEGKQFGIEKISKNIIVVRAFSDVKIHVYPQILFWLHQFNVIHHVYVHSEFCASGGPSLRVLMIPFLMLIKLTGRKITFYAHNVVIDFSLFAPHFGKSTHSWLLHLWSVGYQWYFRLLSWWVDMFVVLEPVIEERLRSLVGDKPIAVHPHWVQPVKKIGQLAAKKILGVSPNVPLIVSFGFVTWYKGADIVVKAAIRAETLSLKYQFVLAGGEACSLKDQPYYRRYYQWIVNHISRLSNMTLTGFLSEQQKQLWLSAADVIILPYRDLMGGSGALQQALQCNKPVLASAPMLAHLGWNCQEMSFLPNSASLVSTIDEVFKQQKKHTLLKMVAEKRKLLRIKVLLPVHYQSVYADNQALKVNPYALALSQPMEK